MVFLLDLELDLIPDGLNLPALPLCSADQTVGLLRKSTVYGLNGRRANYIISLFKVTYKSTVEVSLREFRCLRLMRGDGSPRRLLMRLLPAKPLSVPLRC
jgi:hypothetical protein